MAGLVHASCAFIGRIDFSPWDIIQAQEHISKNIIAKSAKQQTTAMNNKKQTNNWIHFSVRGVWANDRTEIELDIKGKDKIWR